MRSATRLTVATFGALAGLAGVEHGVGEVLQGSVAPAATAFPSWPGSAFFAILNGEPAMSVVPNLLVTGALAILASLALLVWSVAFAGREHGGLVTIALSIVTLLVGGGFGPPLLGMMMGVLATKIDAPLPWWRTTLSASARRTLAVLWPWSYAAALVAWLMLSPGIPLLAYLLGPTPFVEALLVATIPSAFGLLFVTALTGLARDAERQPSALGIAV